MNKNIDNMTVLGIETSCDETAVAIVRSTTANNARSTSGTDKADAQGKILANRIFTQIDMHAPYGGVVPELAARAHLQRLDALVTSALDEADLHLNDMDAIAATAGPGLIGGLLVGLTFAKALALAHGKRFIAINHLEGHALSVRLTDATAFPYLLLLVSGGHCQLLAVTGVGRYDLLGTTRDDAVGEAFDKAAKLLGLGYPGGPEIERLAAHGNSQAFDLPRPLLGKAQSGCDFSFSGLKTALRQTAEAAQPVSDATLADLAASFQAAVLDCLADRAAHAMQIFRAQMPIGANRVQPVIARFVVAGGVAANGALRNRLQQTAKENGFSLQIAPPELCTDNAAMIAWAAAERMAAAEQMAGGERMAGGEIVDDENPMAIEARARWPLTELK